METNNKPISLKKQLYELKRCFPESRSWFLTAKSSLRWECFLQPTSVSRKYLVRLKMKKNYDIEVRVVYPDQLELHPLKKQLPHVYDNRKQVLCLFYPKHREFLPTMLCSETIIPWACEWLLHYEIWLATGVWTGGDAPH